MSQPMVVTLPTKIELGEDKDGGSIYAAPFFALFRFQDNGGNRRNMKIYLASGNLIDHCSAIFQVLEYVSNADVLGFSIHIDYNTDHQHHYDIGSQVEAAANLWIYDDEYRAETHRIVVPSPSPDIFLSASGNGANVVDPSSWQVKALADFFLPGGKALFLGGHEGAGFAKGSRTTRKSQRG